MFSWFTNIFSVFSPMEKTVDPLTGQTTTFIFDPRADFSTFGVDNLKILAVFTHPAVLKIFRLQCDMFSLGRFTVKYNKGTKKGQTIDDDPVLDLFKKPNFWQDQKQFLWDYMFWKMLGNAYCYVDSDNVQSTSNVLQFLDSSKISFLADTNRYKDRVVLSNSLKTEIGKLPLRYTYQSGEVFDTSWSRIIHVADLTSNIGNFFKGPSCIDALYQIISNSKASPVSKNVNVNMAKRFMVAGQADPNNVSQTPMTDPEKMDIEMKMNGPKTVHAVKSMIDIKRFVETASIVGELDLAYWDDYFKIGSMWNIPRDVLEASLKGSTYENQEKARGAHVDYTLSPAGETLTTQFDVRFGYVNKCIYLTWDHLPFVQIFKKEKADVKRLTSVTFANLLNQGVPLDEVNEFLDTNFSAGERNYVKSTEVIPPGKGAQQKAPDNIEE